MLFDVSTTFRCPRRKIRVSTTFRRPRRKIHVSTTFRRPRRKVHVSTTFRRPRRKVHVSTTVRRPRMKVHVSTTFRRPRRKIHVSTTLRVSVVQCFHSPDRPVTVITRREMYITFFIHPTVPLPSSIIINRTLQIDMRKPTCDPPPRDYAAAGRRLVM